MPDSPATADLRNLRGKVIAITGGGSGLGREMALLFARQGARVAVLDRAADSARAVVDELNADQGQEHLALTVDVSSAQDVNETFDRLAREASGVYGLVNSAGIREIASVLELTPAEWERVLAVNLSGTFYCSQAAARQMLASGTGAIVNISSVAGLVAFDNRPAYTASKAGVVGLTKSFAKELAPRGVRVNAICPGLMRTPLTESYFEDEQFERNIGVTVPLGRPGLPHEIAEIALFLLSPASSLISGVALAADGAFMASGTFDISQGDSPFRKSRPGSLVQ